MTTPTTISILGKTWCQAESFEQFRYQEPRNRKRRNSLKYYILYQEDPSPSGEGARRADGAGILIQQTITPDTDPSWLEKAISSGHIYLEKVDHDITKAAIR